MFDFGRDFCFYLFNFLLVENVMGFEKVTYIFLRNVGGVVRVEPSW